MSRSAQAGLCAALAYAPETSTPARGAPVPPQVHMYNLREKPSRPNAEFAHQGRITGALPVALVCSPFPADPPCIC